ncbi:MAG: DUF3179 domain-containing (seleno)protein [Planctomycetota bacterium]|jgi:hypothetical protein
MLRQSLVLASLAVPSGPLLAQEAVPAPEAPPIFSEADYEATAQRVLERDVFPVLTMPTMAAAKDGDEALGPDELVIGLVVDGEAKAYPLRVMGGVELVNDVCGEASITVSW